MTQEEYEIAYFAKWGRPCWEQFRREALADGMTQADAFHAYSRLSADWAYANGHADPYK